MPATTFLMGASMFAHFLVRLLMMLRLLLFMLWRWLVVLHFGVRFGLMRWKSGWLVVLWYWHCHSIQRIGSELSGWHYESGRWGYLLRGGDGGPHDHSLSWLRLWLYCWLALSNNHLLLHRLLNRERSNGWRFCWLWALLWCLQLLLAFVHNFAFFDVLVLESLFLSIMPFPAVEWGDVIIRIGFLGLIDVFEIIDGVLALDDVLRLDNWSRLAMNASLRRKLGLFLLLDVFLLLLIFLLGLLNLSLRFGNLILGFHFLIDLLLHLALNFRESLLGFFGEVFHLFFALRSFSRLSSQCLQFFDLQFCFFNFWKKLFCFAFSFESLDFIFLEFLLSFYCFMFDFLDSLFFKRFLFRLICLFRASNDDCLCLIQLLLFLLLIFDNLLCLMINFGLLDVGMVRRINILL